jgi:hypothetical protein
MLKGLFSIRAAIAAAASAAALLAAPAAAQTWRASSSTDDARAFIDTETIRREGDRVLFWREVRWPKARQLDSGLRYDRIAAHYEGDCRAMTLRTVEVARKLRDRVVLADEFRGELEIVRPGTTAETDIRAACFGEWPEG